MSKYTTEVRFICETAYGLQKSNPSIPVDEIITDVVDKVLNFDYPIFDEEYRKILGKKILKHYYTREIGLETVGLWKLKMNTKLNEIMPYYNQLYKSQLYEFNPLYTTNVTRTHEGNRNENKTEQKNDVIIEQNNSSGDSSNTGTSTDLYSDTPQGALTGLENEEYLTNASKNNNTTNSNYRTNDAKNHRNDTNGNSNANSTENYLETIVGYEGKNASEMLMKYRETFLNIDMMIINELEELFFQLW